MSRKEKDGLERERMSQGEEETSWVRLERWDDEYLPELSPEKRGPVAWWR